MSDLHDRVRGVTGFDMPVMNAELARLEIECENAKADYEAVKEMAKVSLDNIALNWAAPEERRTGKRPSEARAEREARVSPEYKTIVDGVKEAHKTWGRAKALAKQQDNDIWAARQAISFAKTELQNS